MYCYRISSAIGRFFAQQLLGLIERITGRLKAVTLVDEILEVVARPWSRRRRGTIIIVRRSSAKNRHGFPLIPLEQLVHTFVRLEPRTDLTQTLAPAVGFQIAARQDDAILTEASIHDIHCRGVFMVVGLLRRSVQS